MHQNLFAVTSNIGVSWQESVKDYPCLQYIIAINPKRLYKSGKNVVYIHWRLLMSSVVTIEAQVRQETGTSGARKARRQGTVPGVVYGQNKENQFISIDPRSIAKELYIPGFFSRLFSLSIDGKSQNVLVRDVQLHPVTDMPLHIDFMRVSTKSRIHVNIPVNVINDDKAPGVKKGGVVNVIHHTLEVICPADSIPSEITVDLTGMETGQAVHLTDITLPKDVVAAHPERDNTLVSIVAPGGGIKADEEEQSEEAES